MKARGELLVLPLPPSVNNYIRHTTRGIHYKTSEAKAWEEEVGWQLIKHKKYGKALVGVIYNFYFPNNLSDYGNRAKILDDVFQKMSIVDNDRQIMEAHIYKFIDKHNPRVEAKIYPLLDK